VLLGIGVIEYDLDRFVGFQPGVCTGGGDPGARGWQPLLPAPWDTGCAERRPLSAVFWPVT